MLPYSTAGPLQKSTNNISGWQLILHLYQSALPFPPVEDPALGLVVRLLSFL